MIKTQALDRAARRAVCVAAVALISICAACQIGQQGQQGGKGSKPPSKFTHGPHQLGSVCQFGQTSDPINIKFDANGSVLTDPADYVIFACEGDQMVWSKTRPTAAIQITVTIQGPHAKELFKSHDTTISLDPGNPDQTTVEIVDKPQNHIFLHKYSIDVFDPGTGTHYPLDPHVIPMGNGGP
jgi:hypothetical protein